MRPALGIDTITSRASRADYTAIQSRTLAVRHGGYKESVIKID